MNNKKNSFFIKGLIYLSLLTATFFFLFPIYWMFSTSIKPPLVAQSVEPIFLFKPTLENYGYLIFETRYMISFLNSLAVATGHTILILFISIPTAYALSRMPSRSNTIVSFLVLFTRALPPVGIAVPLYILYKDFGMVNSRIGLMIIYVLLNLSFSVWMLKSFIDGLSPELEEAAYMDGCSRLRTIRKITLPLISPGIVATSIYVFCIAWSEFVFAFIFTGFESRTLPVEIQSYITPTGIQWAPMSAGGTLIVAPTIIFYIFIKKYLTRGLTVGGVKE